MDTLAGIAPYALVLACPLIMFICMRLMMNGMHKEPRQEAKSKAADSPLRSRVVELEAENEYLRQRLATGKTESTPAV